eukprot:2823971-Rhodomonas_salina.3
MDSKSTYVRTAYCVANSHIRLCQYRTRRSNAMPVHWYGSARRCPVLRHVSHPVVYLQILRPVPHTDSTCTKVNRARTCCFLLLHASNMRVNFCASKSRCPHTMRSLSTAHRVGLYVSSVPHSVGPYVNSVPYIA